MMMMMAGGAVSVLVSRLAMYVHAVTAMAHWRGVWHLADRYIDAAAAGARATGAGVGLAVCYSTLVALGASHTAIFPPFIVINDMRPDVLVPCTRLRTKAGRPPTTAVALARRPPCVQTPLVPFLTWTPQDLSYRYHRL